VLNRDAPTLRGAPCVMARAHRLPEAIAIAAAIVVLAGDVLGRAAAPAEVSWPVVVVQTCAIWMTAAAGLLISVRRPGHRIGLLLALTALVLAVTVAAEGYARYVVLAGHGSLPFGPWAVLLANATWPLMFAGATAIALVFPDGSLPSRRWRVAAWSTGVSIAGVLVLSLFSPEPFDKPFQDVASPLPARPDYLAPLELLFLAGMVASLVAGVLATRSRYRTSHGIERQQILWLASSSWLIPLTLLVCIVDLIVPGELDPLVLALVLTTALAVPVSIGIAILRWHLYDLDRVVNRALVYGVLTGLVVAICATVLLVLGMWASDRDSFAVTLVGAAVAAIAVNPLRLVLQRAVDRLMYGDRRDPYAGLTRLAERLEATITPPMALRTIVETVAESLKVPFVAVDLVHSGRVERMATHGSPGRGEALRVPLAFQGEQVGQLVVESRGAHEPFNSADRHLLDQLARHAGPVIHAIRLTADLQRSRDRLVRAQEEERRRIRRDLHDGLGPVLATAVFQVDEARDVVGSDPNRADRQLEALRETLKEAVADIRRLVYALTPPALEELGLAPALAEEVARFNERGSGPRITLDLPQGIAIEAVTNAVRHSGAGSCSLTLGINGGLELDVVDDGVGLGSGAPEDGVGIASMKERASELGGALTVNNVRGGGTLVHMTLPLDLA
jgi:two-component system NarL family sensor kinase